MKTKTQQEQINQIVKAVAKVTGVSEQTMLGRLRTDEAVEARWICWHYIHTHMGLQCAVIGRRWGKGVNHATVIHGLKQIAYKLMYARDWTLRPTLEDVAASNHFNVQGERPNSDPKGRQGQDERQPGLCSGAAQWDTEPNVGRVAHGIPSRIHRLKALGNAIVPQVAYEILKRI